MQSEDSEEPKNREEAMADSNASIESGNESGERKSKKKTRLQWDEENLTLNALEMERHPKMKIDEPKTPFAQPASEAGSSTSGSAPSSPAPYFIPRDRLTGFQALEKAAAEESGSTAGLSSGSRITRSVQIVDEREMSADGASSVPNVEFEAKRRKHYANEAVLMRSESNEEPIGSTGASSSGSKNNRSVQIVDEREPAVDGSPPTPNVEFEAKRREHYANEARQMRSEWDEEREHSEDGSGEQVGTTIESVESLSNGVGGGGNATQVNAEEPNTSDSASVPKPNGLTRE